MDNDIKIKKILVSKYRSFRFYLDYGDKNVRFNEDASELIKEKINGCEPFAIGRFGAVEMRCIDKYLKGKKYTEKIKSMAIINAGIFPNNDKMLNRFCEFYLESAKELDILSLWQVKSESKVVNEYCHNAQYINLRGLEPYYFDNPWTKELEGKKVLIIHPFKDSILKQYKNRELLFENKDILPSFKSIEIVQAVQSNAGVSTKFRDWFEAFEYMCKEIDKKDYDIAIIGAGAYGLPLATYIKKKGKKAIQMAGATQILFGIKGKRWDSHPFISNLYNDFWTRPLESETPKESIKVEGGSYW